MNGDLTAMNSEFNGNNNGHFYKIHSINTSPSFIFFLHLKIFTHTYKMAKILFLCITLFVVIVFFFFFTHIEELGEDFVLLAIIFVLPLLVFACIITFYFRGGLD
jgi:hypothetical protein